MKGAKKGFIILLIMILLGCGKGSEDQVSPTVPIRDKLISRIGLTLENSENGLVFNETYLMQLTVFLEDGNIISNPDLNDIYIESINQNVTYADGYIYVASQSFLFRDTKFEFTIKVKDNPFLGEAFVYDVDWWLYNEFSYYGASGQRGSDGESGRSGEDCGFTSAGPGSHGWHGTNGDNGKSGPYLEIYATYIDEGGDGGILIKIVKGGVPEFLYTKVQPIQIKSIGGEGGDGGNGGAGGRGGDGCDNDEGWAGGNGADGGNGGNGGTGGNGGNGGNIDLYFFGNVDSNLHLISEGGDGGTGGSGGRPGNGGLGGRGEPYGASGRDGEQGIQGYNGYDGNIGKITKTKISNINTLMKEFDSLGLTQEEFVESIF